MEIQNVKGSWDFFQKVAYHFLDEKLRALFLIIQN